MRLAVAAWGLLGALSAGALEPPRLLRAEAPLLTLRDDGALVVLEARVNAAGSVTDTRALTSRTPDARAWKRALGRFRFRPAQSDGQPSASRVRVIGCVRAPRHASALTAPQRDAARGQDDLAWPVEVVAPAYPATARGDATVIVDLRVSTTGTPTSASVIEPAPGFDDAAVAAARAWRFAVPPESASQSVVVVFVFREPERGALP